MHVMFDLGIILDYFCLVCLRQTATFKESRDACFSIIKNLSRLSYVALKFKSFALYSVV